MLGRLLFRKEDESIEAVSHLTALREFKKNPELDFYKAQKKMGADAAVQYAYQFFNQRSLMQKFRRELELHSLEYNLENKDYDILIVVPDKSFGFETYNEKMVDQLTRLSTGCGFHNVHRVDIKARSAIDGARQVFNTFKELQKDKKLILISFSHASACVRIMLDQLSHHSVGSIKGWVNLSGLIFGSPSYFCSNKKNLILNRDHELLRSFSSEQRYFVKPMRNLPIKRVHFLGMKVRSQMSVAERRKFNALKAWGPSDGLVTFSGYQKLNDPVIGVLGQSHAMDISSISSVLSRSLCSMVGLLPKTKPVFSEISL